MKICTAVTALLLSTAPAAAQQATITGRVVESGGNAGIVGVTVELTGRTPVLTGASGGFRFTGVTPGRYTIIVDGLGYVRTEVEVLIAGDTTIGIALERAPIPLDSLVVEARDVTVKGVVKDRARDMGLLDVEVRASNGYEDETDGIGRFTIKDVPANVPLAVRVEEFGYLPLTVTLAPANDTTLQFELEPDPIVQRMIEHQKERITERAGERRYPYESTIDRDELLKSRNGTVMEVVRRIIGRRPIGCIAIDERAYSRMILSSLLNTMRPDELEHIDVLYYGDDRRTLMLRMYTRDYVGRMIGNDNALVPLETLVDGANTGDCR